MALALPLQTPSLGVFRGPSESSEEPEASDRGVAAGGAARIVMNTVTAKGDRRAMKRLLAVLMSVAFVAAFTPVSEAQTSCPAEVSKAKEMLAMKGAVAKGQDVQAPRSLAGARGQDMQAPRGQDLQAPRGQDTQAPRGPAL